MKKRHFYKLTFLACALMAVGCDAPRDRRVAHKEHSSSLNSFPSFSGFTVGGPGPSPTNTPTNTTTGSGTGTGTGTSSTNSSVPSEVAHCSWSSDGITGFQSNHSFLGPYTYCKSSTSETTVYIQVKNPITDAYLCMVPTTNNGTKSTYVGEPRCVMASDPKKIYKIVHFKNRSGYSSYPITGSMIMKDKSEWFPAPFYQNLLVPDAYLFCAEYLAQTGNDSYCYSFNSVGKFTYHQF